jgi:regulation of enolase protein 1 (concanavalin A-like superfamily)
MQWLNAPPSWHARGDTLTVTTADHTDFWRHTHYGFVRDSGHFYHQPCPGDAVAEVTLRADYRALYDQGGLMLRAGPENWIKAGVEFTHLEEGGIAHLSVVVTRLQSDWSVVRAPEAREGVRIRLARRGGTVETSFAMPGEPWRMARVAPFPEGPAAIGLMCCSPERAGFVAEFDGFRVAMPA